MGVTGGKQEGTCNELGFDKRSCRGRSTYSDAACLNEVANFSVIVVLGSEGSTMVLICKGAGLVSRVVTKYVRFPRFASQYYSDMQGCISASVLSLPPLPSSPPVGLDYGDVIRREGYSLPFSVCIVIQSVPDLGRILQRFALHCPVPSDLEGGNTN